MSRIIIRNWKHLWNNLIRLSNEPKYIHLRHYCKEDKSEKEEVLEHPSYTYQDTAVEYGIGKKYAVRKLQELFNIRPFTANEIVTKYKSLYVVTGKTMSNNYDLLREHKVPDDLILKYPEVLAQKQLEQKISRLQSLPFKMSEMIPLLTLETNRLSVFMDRQITECKEHKEGRVGFLARLFRISIEDACELLTKRKFLQNIVLSKVANNYKLLTDFGIKNEEIQKDYWVLRYNSEVIRERLDIARMLNLDKMKTWMVRAQKSIFNTYIQRRSDNKLILGDNSLTEYLSDQLQCTVEQSKLILDKHPALMNKSMKKLKAIIDFLFTDGYTPHHILRNPKILLHSVETTRRRLRELEAQGMKVDSLHILTKSQKQYLKYYDSLVKSNKATIKENAPSYLLVLF